MEALFKPLESPEFSAVVNLASDWKTLARILGSENAVQQLAGEMGDAGARAAVRERVLTLVKDEGWRGASIPGIPPWRLTSGCWPRKIQRWRRVPP